MRSYLLTFYVLLAFLTYGNAQKYYKSNDLNVSFESEAPLELIKANSSKGQGVLNLDDGTFAFKVYLNTFHGFNNKLQRIHFMENYMETNLFPYTVFKGHIIEKIDPNIKSQFIRAKGELELHGETKEVIILVSIALEGNSLKFASDFFVLLSDYNIDLPAIVRQKIAEKIHVKVEGELLH